MIEDELVRIWQSSPNQERVKFEKSRLMIEVQSSMDHFHKQVKYRDLREQIAVIIVIPFFAYAAYSIPHLLTKLASVLIIGWAVYVFFRLRNAKKHKPGAFTETYIEYLYKTRAYLQIQKQLMDSVVYWYILPGMLLVILFLMGFIGIPGKARGIMKVSIANALLAVVTYFLNKRSVKRQIMPRLEKVDQLIKVMEKSE
jgi:hypothetical protein